MQDKPPIEPPNPIEVVCKSIEVLASNRSISRDQERVSMRVLEDADFALMANRSLHQGADPEFLRRTAPASVKRLADLLGLDESEAHRAIEQAHKLGPGSLAEDSAQEWLWLLMAMHSLDEAKQDDVDPGEVMRRSAHCLVDFEKFASACEDPETDARNQRERFIQEYRPIGDADLGEGIPLYDSDIGHYVAYRSGIPVAAVLSKHGLVFYGSDGSVTLKESGVEVDKELSPYFGIVFPK